MNIDFEKLMGVINAQNEEVQNFKGPVDSEDAPLGAQVALKFHTDPNFKALLASMLVGAMMFPQEAFATMFAVGYRMGQEDERAKSEVAELNKLFAGPQDPQEVK